MEENIDSINEPRSNEEEPLNKTSVTEKVEKDKSLVNNINSISNEVEAKKQDTTNVISTETNNKNKVASDENTLKKENTVDEISNTVSKEINKVKEPVKTEFSNVANIKPKKEIPIEKKPFNEFVNDHLLPSLINEFKDRGFEIEDIYLKNTFRPIAGDKCWVLYCEIKDICNFWLSFEKEDISSLKSISLCKSNQKPSVLESFLIDEKRITLKLIISRILQRLNGQKLIGIN